MGKSVAEANRDSQEKFGTKNNLFTDFPVGTRVQVISSMVDFTTFNNEIGTVTKNSGSYLGIIVTFDTPWKVQSNRGEVREKKTHNFAPKDLIKLDTSKAVLNYCPHCGHKLPHDEL